jgi:hypothetical protein
MTEKQYREQIARIEERDPQNRWLPVLKRGFSPINVVYLKKAWKTVPKTEHPKPNTQNPQTKTRTSDEVLLQYFREKGHLDRQLRKKSNELRTLSSVFERCAVIDEIQDGLKRIAKYNQHIKFYEEHGRMANVPPPSVIATTDDPIPSDPFEIADAINTAAASLSRIKRELNALPNDVVFDKDHVLRGRYEKLEKNRVRWENRKRILENLKKGGVNG